VEWFGQQGLAITGEGFRRENGWGYRHFLLRTQPVNAAGSRYAAGRHTGTAGCAVSLVAAFCVRRCPSWYCTRMRAGVA
jgi:hypothetical protein